MTIFRPKHEDVEFSNGETGYFFSTPEGWHVKAVAENRFVMGQMGPMYQEKCKPKPTIWPLFNSFKQAVDFVASTLNITPF